MPGTLPGPGALFGASVSVGGFSLAAMAANAPRDVLAALDSVLGLLATGELDLDVTHVGGLLDAAGAQQALSDGRGRGKQVVDVTA